AVMTLRNVTVGAPSAGAGSSDAPAITAGRMTIDLQWLPLLHHSLVIRELAFESARIDLDRFDGEGASLTSFLRVDPTIELPPGWTFALDRIALRDTRVELRGVGADDSKPLEVAVRDGR